MNGPGAQARPVAGRRPAVVRVGALAVATALALFGLFGTPAAAQPTTAPHRPVAQAQIPQRYLDQQVSWYTCVFDSSIRRTAPMAPSTDCATIRVPMDWLHPDDHPDITLAIAYSFATGPSRGLLTANAGGPGAVGRELTAAVAAGEPQLFSNYDLLGVDPRGFGAGQQLSCPTTAGAVAGLPGIVDLSNRSARTHAAELARARLFAQACSSSEFSAFVSTQQMVHDLNFVRTLLGYQQLNVIGYGEGARLGAWYADTYPGSTGKVVLDSGIDWSTNTAITSDQGAAGQLRRVQWYDWLARQNTIYRFGSTAAAVDRRYAEIRASLVDRARAGEGNYPWELDAAVALDLSTDAGFVTAAQTLQRYASIARNGELGLTQQDASAIASLRERLTVSDFGRLESARADAELAPVDQPVDLGPVGTVVRCNDEVHATEAGAFTDQADNLAADYPDHGYLEAAGMCGFWPTQPDQRDIALGSTDGTTAAPLLMVQSTTDPQAGYAEALAARRAAPAVLVTVANSGQHGVSFTAESGCADQAVADYLFGTPLTSDLVCAGTPLPGETAVFPIGPVPVGAERALVGSSRTANPVLADILADAAAR